MLEVFSRLWRLQGPHSRPLISARHACLTLVQARVLFRKWQNPTEGTTPRVNPKVEPGTLADDGTSMLSINCMDVPLWWGPFRGGEGRAHMEAEIYRKRCTFCSLFAMILKLPWKDKILFKKNQNFKSGFKISSLKKKWLSLDSKIKDFTVYEKARAETHFFFLMSHHPIGVKLKTSISRLFSPTPVWLLFCCYLHPKMTPETTRCYIFLHLLPLGSLYFAIWKRFFKL